MSVVVLLGIGFLAGLITALSPCVLPVLPILLAGGATGGSRARPYAIVAGLVGSFTLFTLGGAWLLDLAGLPQDLLRNLAIALLFLLAATLIVPRLGHLLERPLLALTRHRPRGDANGVVLGASLGLVFVPCAGPVLAAMTALAATGRVGVPTVILTLAYAAGAALPMLFIVLGGRRLAGGVRLLRTHAQTTRRAAGVVLGATALAIALGADQRFTTAVPGYTEAFQERVERSSAARRELARVAGADIAAAATSEPLAPEFRGIVEWLNTPGGRPLSVRGLRGKVVLVDFWTYSCINCLRTLPYVKAWDRAYRDEGLVVVGVHTPEFAFERVPDNVRAAVRKLGVTYPVALDNGYDTWSAYRNQYWPAKYLIDRAGKVRFTHFGEGEYDETETWIRRLLGEPAAPRTRVAGGAPNEARTPETYLGYLRLERFANERGLKDAPFRYRFPEGLPPDTVAYDGVWRVEDERIVAVREARLRLHFRAKQIHLVLGGEGRVTISVDGRPAKPVRVRGEPRLYTLRSFPRTRDAILELGFDPGVAAYAFTFG